MVSVSACVCGQSGVTTPHGFLSHPFLAAEDMWHVYNLVREGDEVTATTFRKIAKDSGTSVESERVKIKLTIKVEGIEFDPEGKQAAST